MKNDIKISGIYSFDGVTGPFKGTVTFDEGEDVIYYRWNLYDKEGQFLGHRSMPVRFQQIPRGQDKLEFAREHAMEGIRRYRIGRQKIVLKLYVS
jgi:hypothetical protein